jgi:S1-C subfamily serine protease
MMQHYRLAALTAIMLAGSALPAQAAAPLNGFDGITKSTLRVVVKRPDGSLAGGTGWVIEAASADRKAGNATIATALHVVAGGAAVVVVEPGGQDRPATVTYVDKARDIAFLEVKDLHEPALPLTSWMPKIGSTDPIDSLRSPGFTNASDAQDANTLKDPAAMVTGSLSRVIRDENQVDLIQHSIPVNPGYSGGPVVDDCGRVIGLNQRDGGHIPVGTGSSVPLSQGIAVALQANEIAKVADEARVKVTMDNSPCAVAAPVQPVLKTDPGLKPTDFLTTVLDFLKSVRGIAAIASVAVLAGAGFALYRLFAVETPKVSQPPAQGTPGVMVVGVSPPPPAVRRISLTGREPQTGRVIELNFTSDSLGETGKVLGREGEGLVPDLREKPFVGREQARLRFNGRDFEVIDLHSTNKTWVNDTARSGPPIVPGERIVLHDGASLSFYDVTLKVRID